MIERQRIKNRRGLWQRLCAGLALLPAAVLAAGTCSAQTLGGSFDSTFETLEPIAITQVQALDFGKIIAPTSDTQTFTVNTDGTPVDGTPGNGRFIKDGTQSKGIVFVQGTDDELFSISGAPLPPGDGTCDGPSTLVKMTAVAVDPPGGALDRNVNVGGTLSVTAGAAGTFTCMYQLTADYQ